MAIQVFYDDCQSVDRLQGLSPSAGKPRLLVEAWKRRGDPIELMAVEAVPRSRLYLAHERAYVDGVMEGIIANGFGNTAREVSQTLPWTSGSMLSAAIHALAHQVHACSPSSGFHHAEWKCGGGYCTFNGLMVTAIALHADGLAQRIGIIDIDQHYGNGTDDIIQTLGIDYVRHYTFGNDPSRCWQGGMPAQAWLERLPAMVREFHDCDIILYQAGADPHVDDPLGGALTSAQLRQRDRIVFRELAGRPLVWNLAGGYQKPIEKVLDIHQATLEECLIAARSR
jgi:acetoin utilization deacetylase AcuC-like enzyme